MVELYSIDSDVPLPVRHGRGYHERTKIYGTLQALEVGQSFYIEGNYQTIRHCLWRAGKALNRRFITRSIEGKGLRVWRFS